MIYFLTFLTLTDPLTDVSVISLSGAPTLSVIMLQHFNRFFGWPQCNDYNVIIRLLWSVCLGYTVITLSLQLCLGSTVITLSLQLAYCNCNYVSFGWPGCNLRRPRRRTRCRGGRRTTRSSWPLQSCSSSTKKKIFWVMRTLHKLCFLD